MFVKVIVHNMRARFFGTQFVVFNVLKLA